MKVTINTNAGTIQIHGSFTYGEYKEFMNTLPEAWKEFKFEQPEVVRDNFYPSPLPSFPPYPSDPLGLVWVGDTPPFNHFPTISGKN